MSKRRALFTLFAITFAFHLAGTWALPLIDRDEPRFAEAAREMRQRGDYILPSFNGEPRYDKPPLIYWCLAASFAAFGENEMAARLPSALAAALTSLALFCWAGSVADRRTAWAAALVFATCLQTLVHGKAAVADMVMVLCFTLATWAGWELLREGNRKERPLTWFWWQFYLALALGFLAKGPVAWLPLGWVLLFVTWRQPAKAHAFQFRWGVPLMLGMVALWAVPALWRSHGEFFRIGIGKHVVLRSISPMEGHGARDALTYFATLPFYLLTLFASFFPWSIWLPRLFRLRFRQADHLDKYAFGAALLVVAVFTLLRTKLPHYILPALPLLALLFARWWFASGRPARLLHWCGAGMGIFNAVLALGVMPMAAQRFPVTQLFLASRSRLVPETVVGVVEFNEPSVVWTFRAVVREPIGVVPAEGASRYMNATGPRALLVPSAQLSSFFATLEPDWQSISAEGFNIAKGRRADLTLLIKPR